MDQCMECAGGTMQGTETCKKIREWENHHALPRACIIGCSANFDQENSFAVGMDGSFEKPLPTQKILYQNITTTIRRSKQEVSE
jgi:PleD family two-component response regulator